MGHVVGRRGLECDPKKIEDVKCWPVPDCLKSVRQFLGFVGYYRRFIPSFADIAEPLVALTGKEVPFVWRPECTTAFLLLRDALVRAPILAFPTESGDYVLDTDASNFGLGGVLSQIQNDQERVIAYCSHALRPSQRRYCTTKREMLATVSMCIQFRSYLRGARFIIRTDHKSLVWLHRFKDIEGMMARWLNTLQQFQFTIVHRAGRDHSNADGLSRVPTSPCGQCTRVDCSRVDTAVEVEDQPFDAESVGDSEDADLVPIQSGEDWVAQLDDDLSGPATRTGEAFRISALQLEDTTCIMLLEWIRAASFPPWKEVKGLCPEIRLLWHHQNNLSVDTNGVIWRKRSSQGSRTTCQCFWRCPVSSCPAWFASELYGKDHLEEVHKFSEGRGYSYYECLRRFGLEWYGRRSFFDQRGTTGQALWMDLALARKAGQELHNDYVITAGPEFRSLRSFFPAAVRALVCAYIDYPHPGSRGRNTSFSCRSSTSCGTVTNGTVNST